MTYTIFASLANGTLAAQEQAITGYLCIHYISTQQLFIKLHIAICLWCKSYINYLATQLPSYLPSYVLYKTPTICYYIKLIGCKITSFNLLQIQLQNNEQYHAQLQFLIVTICSAMPTMARVDKNFNFLVQFLNCFNIHLYGNSASGSGRDASSYRVLKYDWI